MKFLLELFTCGPCTSTSSSAETRGQPPAEEIGLLPAAPTPRVGRRDRCRRRGVRKWTPTLTSISEDVSTAEKKDRVEADTPYVRWQRCIKKKILSTSKKDRSRSFDRDEYCRKSVSPSTIMPAFSAPFMF